MNKEKPEIGSAIYELQEDKLLIGRVTNVVEIQGELECIGRADVVIPKDAFVAAYNKWVKRSIKERIREFLSRMKISWQ